MKQAIFSSLFLSLVASFAAGPLSAQDGGVEFPQASPSALVRDTVGLTTVEIEYARPGMKDRKIFGGLVAYGDVWRTGANAATKITFSSDVKFGGNAVPKGTYALFTIPGESEWTVILNKNFGQWGSYGYEAKDDVASVKVKPTMLTAPVETLTIGMAHMRDSSAQLALTWEKTRVAVPIETDLVAMLVPKIEAAMMAEDGKKPYLAAAMFYYEHDVDITKARDWVEAAHYEQPEAVWIVYRKGLIEKKAGDVVAATASAKKSLAMATEAGGSLGAEYKRLSETLLASMMKK